MVLFTRVHDESMKKIDSRNFALKGSYRALVIEELGKEILRMER